MPNSQTNLKKTAATGVFHTDGIGVAPNNPSTSYQGWTTKPTDEGLSQTAGKTTLTTFNQGAQVRTDGSVVTTTSQTNSYAPVKRDRGKNDSDKGH